MSLKLHLGCGEKHIDGYINIDIRYMDSVNKVDNIKYLRSFKLSTVDVIYSCSVLEHFSRWEYKNVLRRWYELLKPGGILRLGVPDFEAIVDHYYNHNNVIDSLIGLLYGGQDYDQNFHHMCWDFDSLKRDLEEMGFKNIHRYDWRETEHSHIDDFSQAYLPHMDKENGKLMHLNVEAIK
ncbi:MAG: class I SAM-dependent methyltransferase [Candidatus Asgardarchaeia archaeon]